MKTKIIPEYHDLLKLVGSSKEHMCPENYIKEQPDLRNSPLWFSFSHHCVRPNHIGECDVYPISKEMFCLHYADVLASTISRKLRDLNHQSRDVFHVWRSVKKIFDEKSITYLKIEDIKPDKDYSEILRQRPEEIGGAVFASLYTHGILTHKWYDFLIQCAEKEYLIIPKEIESRELTRSFINNIEAEKKIYLCFARIHTDTIMVRMRDSHILNLRNKVLKKCVSAVDGAVLYDLSDSVLFVLPCNREIQSILDGMSEKLTSNYYLEVNIKETYLPYKYGGDKEMHFNKTLPDLFSTPEYHIYSPLPLEITRNISNEASRKAIICDLCQKAPASEMRSEDTTEYLCKNCFDLRKNTPNFKKYSQWETGKIALLYLSLDTDLLIKSLVSSFNIHFEKELVKKGSEVTKDELGFSIIYEFLFKYEEFLRDIADTLQNKVFGQDNVIKVLDNLTFVRLKNLEDVMKVLQVYHQQFNNYFPIFISQELSPIYCTILSSNIKFPFSELWRTLVTIKRESYLASVEDHKTVNIHIFTKGNIKTDVWNLDNVMSLYKTLREKGKFRTLRKLAELASFSETLASKMIAYQGRDKDNDIHKLYKDLYKGLSSDPRRPYKLDYHSLLTMAKLRGETK